MTAVHPDLTANLQAAHEAQARLAHRSSTSLALHRKCTQDEAALQAQRDAPPPRERTRPSVALTLPLGTGPGGRRRGR